jgi:hypothetical protein
MLEAGVPPYLGVKTKAKVQPISNFRKSCTGRVAQMVSTHLASLRPRVQTPGLPKKKVLRSKTLETKSYSTQKTVNYRFLRLLIHPIKQQLTWNLIFPS